MCLTKTQLGRNVSHSLNTTYRQNIDGYKKAVRSELAIEDAQTDSRPGYLDPLLLPYMAVVVNKEQERAKNLLAYMYLLTIAKCSQKFSCPSWIVYD